MERLAASTTQAKACATLILLACCPCASALNPSLEGFFKGYIDAIAQTPDGDLWLGAEFGLLRFDGVRGMPWQPPAGEHLPTSNIRRLLATREGRLWTGADRGLSSWKDGKLTYYAELVGQDVLALREVPNGTIRAGGLASPTGRLRAIQNRRAHCYGEDSRFGRRVTSLYASLAYMKSGDIRSFTFFRNKRGTYAR